MQARGKKQNKRGDECAMRQDFMMCSGPVCICVFQHCLKTEWFRIMVISISLSLDGDPGGG